MRTLPLGLWLLIASASAAPAWKHLPSQRIYQNGPNCWSAALLGAGILRAPRYVDNSEMEFWANSPFCRSHREAAAGRIVLVQKRHAFYMINESESFSKFNLSAYSPYRVLPFAEALAEYPAASEALRYVSCESWQQVRDGASAAWRKIERRLNVLETKMSRLILSDSGSIPQQQGEMWLFELQRIEQLLNKESSTQHDVREAARWGSLRARLPSLEWQIREFVDPS